MNTSVVPSSTPLKMTRSVQLIRLPPAPLTPREDFYFKQPADVNLE